MDRIGGEVPSRLNTYIGDTEGKISIVLEARDGLT
jgi:hypothetical protein